MSDIAPVTSHPNALGELYAALAQAQAEFEPVQKTKTVQVRTRSGETYKFDYAPLDEFLRACRKALAKRGLACGWRTSNDSQTITVTAWCAHGNGAVIEASLTWGMPGDIKEFGGVQTYLRRYTLASLLGVVADEDDDGNLAAGDHRTVADRTPRTKSAPPVKAPEPIPAPEAPSAADPRFADKSPMLPETYTAIGELFAALKLEGPAVTAVLRNVVGRNQAKDMTQGEAMKLHAHLMALGRAAEQGK